MANMFLGIKSTPVHLTYNYPISGKVFEQFNSGKHFNWIGEGEGHTYSIRYDMVLMTLRQFDNTSSTPEIKYTVCVYILVHPNKFTLHVADM